MPLPISARLFLVSVASMLVVGLLGLGLIRWSLSDARPEPRAEQAFYIVPLVADLTSQFERHGDWRFLPPEGQARDAWLRARVARATTAHREPGALDPTLADRIALTDAEGQLLAGAQPAAPLVALASIDTRRWTIHSRNGIAGHLAVAVPSNPDDALTIAFLLHKQRPLAWLAVIAFVLSALAAALVATSFRRPLHALVESARRLGRGELATRIDARRRDEFGELARTFNDLASRLEDAAQSRRQWIADTSHELRTPLAVLKAQIEAMQDGVRPLAPESLASMDIQVRSLQALVDDLDQLARGDSGTLQLTLQPLDAWSLACATWDDFAERLQTRGLHARLQPPTTPATVLGDAARLRQVLRNLLENTARYTAPGGQVTLQATVDASHLHLHLDDSAPAVPDAALARLGERFFRADPSRSREHGGSGLGLALARQIIQAHGGRLSFAPSPLGGLRVTVQLPLEGA